MHSPLPVTRELLLVGGGHTHALVLRLWAINPLPGVRMTIVNPEPTAPYSGMLPGFVAGHYSRQELDIDLVRLARFAGARLIRGRAIHLDSDARCVTLEDGRRLSYHVVALDIGITSEMPSLKGFSENAIPAKPLGQFASQWENFHSQTLPGNRAKRAAVIGGGVAGVELAMAMAHQLSQGGGAAEISLIERAEILPGMAASRLSFFRDRLAACGVKTVENARIIAVKKGQVDLENKPAIPADFIVGAAGARAQNWLRDSGLALHEGFVTVDQHLRSLNQSTAFATGDCAHLSHDPRPKAGVFAVRQAPVLFANLRAALSGGKMRSFQPQGDYLKLISLGEKSALADKWGLMFRGHRVWHLKDRIDRKFMDQFADLKPMPGPALVATVADGVADIVNAAPLCGGCGAKIGGHALKGALENLTFPERNDVMSGPGDDAATLKGPAGNFQVISTDHLRAFSNDPIQVTRVAALHALGDIWAMGAAPQTALASIILPPLSAELQEIWLRDIMTTANEVLAAEGAAIVGGHSANGAELNIGFTVTGLHDGQPIKKSGAKVGDHLILTRPIGTGVILAGEMALKARGDQVSAAYDTMTRSQGDAARLLSGAHAMTDVTGFGLAGHLGEIAQASGVGYEIRLADIAVLPGALELTQRGVASSLFAENRALSKDVQLPENPKANLLFDPQTAGGLLAAVPAGQSEGLIRKIRSLGHGATVIGKITKAALGRRVV